jgi:hypothetical protein
MSDEARVLTRDDARALAIQWASVAAERYSNGLGLDEDTYRNVQAASAVSQAYSLIAASFGDG